MALRATMYNFEVALSDVDRGVYESLSIKAACHPSETEEYFATRILAYCLEYREGIAFSKGISEPDVPAISVRDLTGALQSWIEVGSPVAARPPREVRDNGDRRPAFSRLRRRRFVRELRRATTDSDLTCRSPK